MNRWEAEQKIAIAALNDPAFKKKLLSNPKKTIEDFLKKEMDQSFSIEENLEIDVREEKKHQWIISIPYFHAQGHHLSPEELKKVSAGLY